ncbi:hypothetical protein [Desulfotalea psychrophila]|nr:hypothetical protein [Desulfotalea psychrophila]
MAADDQTDLPMDQGKQVVRKSRGNISIGNGLTGVRTDKAIIATPDYR